VAATAIEIARRHGAQVTAVDISPLMLKCAGANARATGMTGLVTVTFADIVALPFGDGAFDVVIAEAVTMFADRPKVAAELARVTKAGGRVLATEFYWRKPPTEGATRCLAIMGRVAGRPAYTRKMAWLIPRMAKAIPYLGYIVVAGVKTAQPTTKPAMIDAR
jgi:ubiquinone/menaquinone biosynthesis C-methylase UbiE